MAFENINWSGPAKARQAEQAQFQDMLGNAIKSYQQGKELDLKRRQMEMEGIDVQKVAENALVKQNMGMPLTSKEQAAIQTMGQIGRPQIYTDSFGQQVVQPSPWAALTGGSQAPTPQTQPTPGGHFSGMMGGVPPVTENQLNQQRQPQGNMPLGAPLNEYMVSSAMETMPPVAPKMPANEMPDLKVDGSLSGTPRGALMEAEAALKLKGEKAKIDMEKEQKGLSRFNGEQLAAANFANRLVKSSDIINQLEGTPAAKAKTGPAGYAESIMSAIPSAGMLDALGQGIVKISATPKQQKYLNAAQNWIRANLRKESGAVISPQEMIDEYSTYFPTAGDTPEVIKQKADLRKETEKGMIGMSAGSYQEMFGKKSQSMQDKKPKLTPEQARAELLRRRGGQ